MKDSEAADRPTTDLVDALVKIHKILEPFIKEDRKRIIAAANILIGNTR